MVINDVFNEKLISKSHGILDDPQLCLMVCRMSNRNHLGSAHKFYAATYGQI